MSDGRVSTDLRLVPAAAACWLACGLALGYRPGVVAAAAFVLATGAVLVVRARSPARPPIRGRRWRGTAVLTLVAAGAGLASYAGQAAGHRGGALPHLVAQRAVVTVVGVVRAEVVQSDARSDRFMTVLAVEQVEGRGRSGPAAASLLVRGGPAWRGTPYGTRVRVTGRVAPGAPADRTSAVLTAWGEVRTMDRAGPIDGAVARLRTSLLEVTDPLPADLRGLVPGAAIGDTSRVPMSLAAAMREVSLTHVTAVSGSHFAVLAVTVLGVTGALRMPRTARAAASVVVLGGFVLLVHPEPSVVRAAVMGAVAAWGLLLGRRSSAVPALMASVVALLVLDPWLSRSFGFTLSVLATAAIVLLAPVLARRLSAMLPRWMAVAFAVPASAQLVCAPVVVLLDPAVSLVATPANLLAAPALVPATLLGLAATVVAPWFPDAAGVLAWGAAAPAWWVAAVARAGAALPGGRVDWPAGAPGLIALLVVHAAVAVAVLGHERLRRERRPWLLMTAAVLLVGLVPGVRSSLLRLAAGG